MKIKILAFAMMVLAASFSLSACCGENNTNITTTETTTIHYNISTFKPNSNKPFLHKNPSDTETSTELTTEPETVTKETTVSPPETNTFISNPNLKSYAGKKLTELEKDGFVYCGYIKAGDVSTKDSYVFYYTHNNMGYKIQTDVPQETGEALEKINSFEGDKETKLAELKDSITITKITTITDKPLSASELSEYKGKKASVLIENGFEQTGYYNFNDRYLFEFRKGNQAYQVTFNEDIENLLKNTDPNKFNKEKVLNSPIKEIEYAGPVVF